MTGVVKWFDPVRGFGFILREGYADVFVHYTRIASKGYRSLDKGDIVEYEIGGMDDFGRIGAVQVVKVSSEDAGILHGNGELLCP